MNMKAVPGIRRRHILAGSIASALLSQVPAWSQSVWDGGGANALWSTAANWAGDVAPISPTALTFDGVANLNPNNDLTGFDATGITFSATAGQFTLGGNDLLLDGNVTNLSAFEQKLNFNSITMSVPVTFDTGASNITVGAQVFSNTGAIVTKTGSGTLKFTNNGFLTIGNANGGAFQVSQGSVILDGGAAATYNVAGEFWVGTTANQNASTTLNTGTMTVNSWVAVARGNGNGTVSSDLILNDGTHLTTANFSVGYNVNNAANTPRGSVTLNGSAIMDVTNTGNLFILGESAGSNAVIRLNGTSTLNNNSATGASSRIGNAGKGLINIASPTATFNLAQAQLGAAANGAGAIWNRGILTISSGASINHFALGNATGGYGYYLHDTVTPVTFQELGIGGAGGGSGVFEIRSGTVSSANWVTINRTDVANAVSSMLLIDGGTLVPPNIGGRFYTDQRSDADAYALIDVGANSRIAGGPNSDINLQNQPRAGHTTVLNIHDGGSVEVPRVFAAQGAGTSVVNLNGGKLVATATNGNFLGPNLDGIFIQSGGATIDTNGFNSTVTSPVLAPTGNGLTSIPLSAGGSGYIGRPIVQITGGGGGGAAAIANFDEVTGAITGITITSPGSGYTSVPTITLIGGGGTGATIGTAAIGAVAAGGALTKVGNGTLTLSTANTYSGGTAVNTGVLSVTNTTGSGTGTGAVSVNNSGALSGSGTVSGAVTVASGAAVAPGVGVGTLTVGAITFAANSVLNFEITDQNVLDRLAVSNTDGLVINGGGVNLYVPNSTTTFSASGVYNLLSYAGAIGGTGIGSLSVLNTVAGKTYTFGQNAGFVTLTIATAGATPNFWNVDADGNWTVGTNWSQNTAPNAPGAIANFGGGGATITAPRTVTLNSAQVVGSLGFNSVQPYTIAGTNVLTLNNGAVPSAEITVSGGSHTISVPMNVMSATAQFTIANAADSLTVSGSISGGAALTKLGNGTLILSGSNSYTGDTVVFGGILQIAGNGSIGPTLNLKNGTTLRIVGATATLSKPITFDIGSSTPVGISGAANGTANFTISVPAGSNATIASAITINSGSQLKIGGGTLTLTNPGDNVLSNVGGIGYVVQEGDLVIDGGAASTYAVTGGELAVGDNTPNQTSLTIKSGTVNVGTYTSVGRGNGTTGLQSTLNVTGGTLNTVNLFSGFSNNVAGYNARPIINLSNAAVVNAIGTGNNQGVRLGESPGSFSTLNLSDSATLTSSADFQIGFGGTAVVNISGNTAINTSQFGLGFGNNVVGNTGTGIINQTGGTVQQSGNFGGDWRIGGYNGVNDALAYGSYTLSAGQMSSGPRNIQIGAFGLGVLDIRGGTATSDSGYPVVGRFQGSFGLMNISSGSYTQSGQGNLFIIGEQGVGVVNLSGTGSLSVAAGPGNPGTLGGTGGLRLGHTATGNGTLNLNGGTLTTTGIAESLDAGKSFVYLNGGTIKASSFSTTFFQGIDNAVVGPNGAIFDTDGNDVTVAQSLASPTGQGVASIPVSSGGAGYLGQPIVQISGDGVGATAVAVVTGGVVTGITITNPGIGYTTAPTVTLAGGGATTTAALNPAVIASNVTTGGLTKRGDGTLTLAGINTYTGTTTVEKGTLSVVGSVAGNVNVTDVSVLELVGTISGSILVGSEATMRGNGTANGAVTVNGVLQPGIGIGTLTFTNTPLTLSNGSLSTFELGGRNVGEADKITGISLLTMAGTIQLTLAQGFDPQMGDSFDLFDASTVDSTGFNMANELILPALGPGLLWKTDQFVSTGVLVVVPEPGAFAALIGGIGMLTGFRRIRRK